MTTRELGARFKTLSEVNRETSQLIAQLSKVSIQPGSTSPNSDDGDARVELSSEIHQRLKEEEEELELLKQETEDIISGSSWGSTARRRDSEKDKERIGLVSQVERLGEDLKLARSQFRKAQLQAKRNVEALKRRERELLFAGVQEGQSTAGPGKRRGQEKLSQDEFLVNTSTDVTAALRRTHQLMQSELERSKFAHDTLKQSTAALTTLNESYNTLDDLLSSSRTLVSTLQHSQKSDTWYLETAFYVLLTTVAWLFFRRILYGPGWWLLYLPTKLLFRGALSVLQAFFAIFAPLLSAVGGSSQSAALSKASTGLITQASARGEFPKFSDKMAAPSIKVGSGGEGAKRAQEDQGSIREGMMIDKIGKMIDNKQESDQTPEVEVPEQLGQDDQGTVLRERRDDEQPNPKKRMFEEPLAGERVRDGL